ncbi:hypothetical protein QR685DRAFT_450345 [Neurospora intermedia]|uniref:Uncharacterized protein n=1 Tax=Neurospora intermedia TaxID=5142 RepID=A0ABR3D2I6_NEUIN
MRLVKYILNIIQEVFQKDEDRNEVYLGQQALGKDQRIHTTLDRKSFEQDRIYHSRLLDLKLADKHEASEPEKIEVGGTYSNTTSYASNDIKPIYW